VALDLSAPGSYRFFPSFVNRQSLDLSLICLMVAVPGIGTDLNGSESFLKTPPALAFSLIFFQAFSVIYSEQCRR